MDKGVWSSTGSRWKVFAFREKVVGQRLRGSGMIELMGQAAAQAAGFGEDLFAGWFAESEDEFLVLQRREKGHIVLVIDDNDRKGGAQEFQGTGASFGV